MRRDCKERKKKYGNVVLIHNNIYFNFMDKLLFIYTTQFHENVRRNGMIVRQKSLNHLTSLASDKAEKIENE
jgi:hypothetical protein